MEFPSRLFELPLLLKKESMDLEILHMIEHLWQFKREGQRVCWNPYILMGNYSWSVFITNGAKGMYELGQNIMQKSQYAIQN